VTEMLTNHKRQYMGDNTWQGARLTSAVCSGLPSSASPPPPPPLSSLPQRLLAPRADSLSDTDEGAAAGPE
jgi:hypothetical protein